MSSTPLLDWNGPPRKSEARLRFEDFDRDNPQVYALFRKFALQAMASGRKRIGGRLIAERIRWETFIITKDDDGYKINDHYTPFYVRKFIAEFPDYEDRFELRVQKSDIVDG